MPNVSAADDIQVVKAIISARGVKCPILNREGSARFVTIRRKGRTKNESKPNCWVRDVMELELSAVEPPRGPTSLSPHHTLNVRRASFSPIRCTKW